jgi:hypothetical protein
MQLVGLVKDDNRNACAVDFYDSVIMNEFIQLSILRSGDQCRLDD